MASNYFIAVGGTGARCLEAVVYLTAIGLFTEPLHVLLVDPDTENGNGADVLALIANYHKIFLEHQPENPKYKWSLMKSPPKPSFFQTPVNKIGNSASQYPTAWNYLYDDGRKFKDFIQYETRPPVIKNFISLFYDRDDLEIELDEG